MSSILLIISAFIVVGCGGGSSSSSSAPPSSPNTSLLMFGEQGFVGSYDPSSEKTSTIVYPAYKLSAIVYGNGKFVAVGNTGSIRTSKDGLTWNNLPTPTKANLNAIAYDGESTFIAVGLGGTILSSKDGDNWSIKRDLSYENSALRALVYGNGKFIATSDSGDGHPIISSDGGDTWSEELIPIVI